MVKWTIFIAAYTAGFTWLSMRWMEASGTGPMTPRGRVREMGWGLALLALAISLFGLNGVNHWPTLIAMLIAGLVLVLLPRQAAWLVAVMLIALGLYGFLLVGAYQRGDSAACYARCRAAQKIHIMRRSSWRRTLRDRSGAAAGSGLSAAGTVLGQRGHGIARPVHGSARTAIFSRRRNSSSTQPEAFQYISQNVGLTIPGPGSAVTLMRSPR